MKHAFYCDIQLQIRPSMPLKTLAMTVVLTFVLQQPGAALFSLLVFGKASVPGLEIIPRAWAEDEHSGGPETPPMQQGERKPSENPQEPEGHKAPEPPPAEQPQPLTETPLKPEERKAETGFVDMLHGGISSGLLSTAEWLDSFFADERALKEENHSYIRVRYDVFQEEKSNVVYQPIYDLRLVLPQLQKKTHLIFSSEPSATPHIASVQENITGARVHSTGEKAGTTEERNLTTAVHYFFRSTAEESFVVRTGAQFSHGSPVLFIAPRYRALIPFKPWDFRFSQEAVYRTDTRWQAETIVDFERPLPHELFFRASVDGIWDENVNGYFYSLTFSLRHPFDPTHALDYEWSNSYQTRPVNELAEIALRIRYRHSVWRSWIFFELAPQCRFPRDRNFQATPGILFRFEMFFGRKA